MITVNRETTIPRRSESGTQATKIPSHQSDFVAQSFVNIMPAKFFLIQGLLSLCSPASSGKAVDPKEKNSQNHLEDGL